MMIQSFLPVALIVFAASGQAHAQASGCPQFFPDGQPPALVNPSLGQRTTLLCNDAYAVLASGVTHGAIWSAEHPTAASLDAARGTRRESEFHADDRLAPADQAQLADYRRSGFDRGHMTPSGDMPDAQAQQQTFSLANMVPQTAELNRGVWEGIESAVRNLAVREGELYLVTGPAFVGQRIQSIGPDCGFRRCRSGIPNMYCAPFRSDAARHSNLMAPGVVSSRGSFSLMSWGRGWGQVVARFLRVARQSG